jgi:hypothetical protein
LYGASSSDEDLLDRLARTGVVTPDNGIPDIEGQRRFTGTYSFRPSAPPATRRRDSAAAAFSEILAEIENARFAVTRAFKTVMLGAQAAIRPELVEPGAGPIGVRQLLGAVRDLERDVHSASPYGAGIFLHALPRNDDTEPRLAIARNPSIADRRTKLLPAAETAGAPCLCVALGYDDYRALEMDAFGRIELSPGKVIGVTPYLLMPPRGMAEAARQNETRYTDRAGLGHHVPTFVRLYAALVAFALQDHPALLAAALLARRHPQDAAQLVALHAKLVEEVSAAVLYFLGYEDSKARASSAVGRRARDTEILCDCGLRLFDALVDWRNQCCRSMIAAELVESYCALRIEKVGDLTAHALNRRTIPPPARCD